MARQTRRVELSLLIGHCERCQSVYETDKSGSSLRLTYCSIMCEVRDLGYHLNSFIDGKYKVWNKPDEPRRKKESVRPSLVEKDEPDDDTPRELVPA